MVDDFPIVFQHPLAAAGDDAGVAASGLDHQRTFAQGSRLGLLAVHVLAAAAGLDHHDRVPMIGRGDMHRVDVRAGQQLAEVVVGLAVGVLVVFVHLALGLVAGALAHIADGHVLDIRTAQERALVAASHVADADAAHHDPVAGRRDISVPKAEEVMT